MAKALPVFATNPQGALRDNAPLILHIRLEEMLRYSSVIHDAAKKDELHAMRIAAKRLRYTMEIFAPCYPEKEYNRLYNQVKAVQEKIGEIHDADVRGPLFEKFIQDHATHRPEIRVGLDKLVHTEQTKRGELYSQFLTYWNRMQKQGFKKKFLQLMIQDPIPQQPEEAQRAAE